MSNRSGPAICYGLCAFELQIRLKVTLTHKKGREQRFAATKAVVQVSRCICAILITITMEKTAPV